MSAETVLSPPRDGDEVHIVIPGDPLAVRDGLRALFEALLSHGLTEADRGTAELVLAEVLNNIVEHAYATLHGEIDVTLRLSPGELVCRVVDTGRPMPDDALPDGTLAPLGLMADLPEGGFGWFLIRSLSQDLCYRREGGRNLLCFRLQARTGLA